MRKITMKIANSIGKKSLRAIPPFVRYALLVIVALVLAPAAQAFEAVDVQQRGADTEITVQFASPVLYLRHNPLNEGGAVRIYLRFVGIGVQDDLAPDTRHLPASGSAPAVTISYPETDGALSVTFDRSTRFSVRPSPDGRSISILIPNPGG